MSKRGMVNLGRGIGLALGLSWAAALAAGGAGTLAWNTTPLPTLMADQRSGTGERRRIRLDDGSQLQLNTASAVDIRYSNSLREVRLLSGEIHIETARDTLARPFIVHTAQGSIRALGTRFTVWRSEDHETLLAVYQGAVAVTTAEGATMVVPAGQQLSFTAAALGPVGPADPAREAWSQGMLVVQDGRKRMPEQTQNFKFVPWAEVTRALKLP